MINWRHSLRRICIDKQVKKLYQQALFLALASGVLLEILLLILCPYIPVWMGAEPAIRDQAFRYFFIISVPLVFRYVSTILGAAFRAVQDTKTPVLGTSMVSCFGYVVRAHPVNVPLRQVLGAGTSRRLVLYDRGQCVQGSSLCGPVPDKTQPGEEVAWQQLKQKGIYTVRVSALSSIKDCLSTSRNFSTGFEKT